MAYRAYWPIGILLVDLRAELHFANGRAVCDAGAGQALRGVSFGGIVIGQRRAGAQRHS